MLDINHVNQMLINTSKALGLFCLLLIGFTVLQRFWLVKKKKRINQIGEKVSLLVSEVLFFDSKKAKHSERAAWTAKKAELREWSAQKEYRSVIVDQLLKLQWDVTGGTKIALMALYKDLGLHLFAVQKLKSWRWSVVSSAILELSQMHITEAYIPIRKFLNDHRVAVREQAELAIISLKEEGISHYLHTVDKPISEWQQFKIIEILRSKNAFDLPIFSRWFTSNNSDVVMLAMRMAEAFGQRHIGQDLDLVLDHGLFKVRDLAYGLVQKFKVYELLPKIKSRYWQSEEHERAIIINTLRHLGRKDDIDFLEEVLTKETGEHLINLAFKALESMAPERAKMIDREIKDVLSRSPIKVVFHEKVPSPQKEGIGKPEEHIFPNLESQNLLANYFSKDNFERYILLDKVLKMHNPAYLPIIRKIVYQEQNLSIKIKALEIMQDLGVRELPENSVEVFQKQLVTA